MVPSTLDFSRVRSRGMRTLQGSCFCLCRLLLQIFALGFFWNILYVDSCFPLCRDSSSIW